ncbi:hypothetical protein D1AOALGA4SA_9736 [Olavius algarvensis Delta 1 endosymbiont]|nr:hypothetical protein D1AOALGA4SA_9736 [Olavius algarvensis Delta 1 endosymbiont]
MYLMFHYRINVLAHGVPGLVKLRTIGTGFDFTPRGVEFTLESQWNNGMVEEWNIGNTKRMTV